MSPKDEAAGWLVLQGQRELTASESQAFEEWLRHPQNAAAWSEAQRSWNVFQVSRGVAEQEPQLEALRQAALATRPLQGRDQPASESGQAPEKAAEPWLRSSLRSSLWPSRLLPFSAAAALVLAIGAALLWQTGSDGSLQTQTASTAAGQAVASYSTQIGERRQFSLPDGTRLSLNTRTEVEVRFTPAQRAVQLRNGQATFEVAKDASRPFLVEAGDRTVRAVGTVFDVYLAPQKLRVTLTEGKVTVGSLGAATNSEKPLSLAPGEQLVAVAGTDVVQKVDVTRALLWHDGMVEFNNETLGDAVAEMNRYSPLPVHIRDEKTRSLRFSGLFHTDRMEQFLQVVQELLPVKVGRDAGGQTEITGLE